ncbi:MAG: hypothetical protein JST38_17760 [Bacteroidetes bacterium]|nr:hypothetical protein [Bacteroidota bacterium]
MDAVEVGIHTGEGTISNALENRYRQYQFSRKTDKNATVSPHHPPVVHLDDAVGALGEVVIVGNDEQAALVRVGCAAEDVEGDCRTSRMRTWDTKEIELLRPRE